MSYFSGRTPPMTRALEKRASYAPPYTTVQMSGDAAWILEDTLEKVGLVRSETVTPWASSEDGLKWQAFPSPPAENVGLYPVTFSQLEQLQRASMGYWLPFIAVMNDVPPTIYALETNLEGTPYRYHETYAVYLQSDYATVPKVWYLIWLEARPADDPKGGVKSLNRISYLHPLLVTQREPYDQAKSRPVPPISFAQAWQLQTGMPGSGATTPLDEWMRALPVPDGSYQSPGLPQFPKPALPELPGDVIAPPWDGTIPSLPGPATPSAPVPDYPSGVVFPEPEDDDGLVVDPPQPAPVPAPRQPADNTIWWVAGGAIAVIAIATIARSRS